MAKRKNIKAVIRLLKNDKSIKFYMGTLCSDYAEGEKPAGCIAAFAYTAAKGRVWKSSIDESKLENKASNFLGLDADETNSLFYPGYISFAATRRKHAIKVLKHLRKTGKVDWSVSGVPSY